MSFFRIEPERSMRADGHPWGHRVRVAVPISYDETDRAMPVLWITDGNLEAAVSVLGLYTEPQLILVSVGADKDADFIEADRRRNYDLLATEDLYFEGPEGRFLRGEYSKRFADHPRGGGADRFLDFLIEDVRSALATEYRMSTDHGLFGVSLGGAFVARAIFERPGAFTRYICASPGIYAGGESVLRSEEQYARQHRDLDVAVALAAGEAEVTEPLISAWGIVSSTAKLAERLTIRSYPSLRLGVKFFRDETHASLIHPCIGWGARMVWGDEFFRNPFRDEEGRVPGRPVDRAHS